MSELVGDPDRIPPVWDRLPQVFAYPLKSASMVALGLYTAIFFAGLLVPLIGIFLVLLAWIGLYKFAYDVLESTAYGRLDPPETQGMTTSWVLVKHLAMIAAMFLAIVGIVLFTNSLTLAVVVALFMGLRV
jgi:hypothetical protein